MSSSEESSSPSATPPSTPSAPESPESPSAPSPSPSGTDSKESGPFCDWAEVVAYDCPNAEYNEVLKEGDPRLDRITLLHAKLDNYMRTQRGYKGPPTTNVNDKCEQLQQWGKDPSVCYRATSIPQIRTIPERPGRPTPKTFAEQVKSGSCDFLVEDERGELNRLALLQAKIPPAKGSLYSDYIHRLVDFLKKETDAIATAPSSAKRCEVVQRAYNQELQDTQNLFQVVYNITLKLKKPIDPYFQNMLSLIASTLKDLSSSNLIVKTKALKTFPTTNPRLSEYEKSKFHWEGPFTNLSDLRKLRELLYGIIDAAKVSPAEVKKGLKALQAKAQSNIFG